MRLRDTLIVYRKEMRDSLRDRRTLISMIVVPVLLIPVLMFGMAGLAAIMMVKAQEEDARVAIVGAGASPELAARIAGIGRFQIVDPPEDPDAAVADRTLRAVAVIPEGFDAGVTDGEQPEVSILYHEGDVKSEMARRDIASAAKDYRQELLAERLRAEGLDEGFLRPFEIRGRNVAPMEKVGARALGGILPYIIILMGLTGAMYPAVDLTAGEKERGTIETILASSVSRLDLVLGKFLTVLTASVATVLLSLSSLAATAMLLIPVLLGAGEAAKVAEVIRVDPAGVAMMLLLILPLTAIFASVLLTVSLFAKSYKEAQSYVGPMMILVVIPAVIGMLPGFELTWGSALVPIVGTSLASKEVLAGAFPWGLLALIFLSSCVYAGIALWMATRMFRKESVLFRS